MPVQATQLNRLLAQLEARGKRVTAQRAAICEALVSAAAHPTASEIWQLVQRSHPSISQATVYNTLAALEDLELIRPLGILGDEHTHYDLCVEPHVNVVCTVCGRIADVHTDTLEALLGLVSTRTGYRLAPQEGVVAYGMCSDCVNGSAQER